MINLRTQSGRNLRAANPPTAETRSRSFSGNLSMTDTWPVERHLSSVLRAEFLPEVN
jgi:hypothetical protein